MIRSDTITEEGCRNMVGRMDNHCPDGRMDNENRCPDGRLNNEQHSDGRLDNDHQTSCGDEDSDTRHFASPEYKYFIAQAPDGGYGWVVCACAFIGQMISDGIVFSFGVVFVALLDHFKAGRSETAWVGAILLGMSMISGPFASALANRYSLRAVGIAGALIAALGLLLSAFAPNILTLTVTYGLICGTGVGFTFLTSILVVSLYFKKRRALANGLAMCGSGVGVFVLSPLLEWLLEEFGWSGCMILLAGLALQGCIFAAMYRPLPLSRQTVIKYDSNQYSDIAPPPAEIQTNVDKPYLLASRPETPLIQMTTISDQVLIKNDVKSKSASHLHVPCTVQYRCHSSTALHQGGYWDTVATTKLSHLVICQIGSLHNIPTAFTDTADDINKQDLPGSMDHSSALCCRGRCGLWLTRRFSYVSRSFGLNLLRDPIMVLLVISSVLWTGQATTYMYLVDYACSIGIDLGQAALLLSAVGITNCIGRVLVGSITDNPRVNSTVIYTVAIFIAGLVNIILPFIANFHVLIVLASVFGFSMASYVSLRSIILVDLMGLENLACGLGLVVMFQGFAFTIVAPISGAVLESTRTYKAPFIACGLCYILSTCAMLPIFALYRRLSRHSDPPSDSPK